MSTDFSSHVSEPKFDKELVLSLACEGGGRELYRTRAPSGGWIFHAEGTSMDLDDNDNEVWREWNTPTVDSWEAAIKLLGENWMLFTPLEVHPDYRARVWAAAERQAQYVDENLRQVWMRQQNRWRELTRHDRSTEPHDKPLEPKIGEDTSTEQEETMRRKRVRGTERATNFALATNNLGRGVRRKRSIIKVKIEDTFFETKSIPELYRQALIYLVENGRLDNLRLPVSSGRKRHLLAREPKHPGGANFTSSVEYQGYYMEAHNNRKAALSHLGRLLQQCGLSFTQLDEADSESQAEQAECVPLQKIQETFEREFKNWGIILPIENIRRRTSGRIVKGGWHIGFVFGVETDGSEYLEYYATHRMTEDIYAKICESGETELLEAPSGMFVIYYPGKHIDPEQAEQEMFERNRRIYAELERKGLVDFTAEQE